MSGDLPATIADADADRTFVVGKGDRFHLPAPESTADDPDSLCSRSHANSWREKRAAVLYDDLELCERCRNAVTETPNLEDSDAVARGPADVLAECGFEEAAENADQRRLETLAQNGQQTGGAKSQ